MSSEVFDQILDPRVRDWLLDQAATDYCPYCSMSEDYRQQPVLMLIHMLDMHCLRFGIQKKRLKGEQISQRCLATEFTKREDEKAVEVVRERIANGEQSKEPLIKAKPSKSLKERREELPKLLDLDMELAGVLLPPPPPPPDLGQSVLPGMAFLEQRILTAAYYDFPRLCSQCRRRLIACRHVTECSRGIACGYSHPACPVLDACQNLFCGLDHPSRPRTCCGCRKQRKEAATSSSVEAKVEEKISPKNEDNITEK